MVLETSHAGAGGGLPPPLQLYAAAAAAAAAASGGGHGGGPGSCFAGARPPVLPHFFHPGAAAAHFPGLVGGLGFMPAAAAFLPPAQRFAASLVGGARDVDQRRHHPQPHHRGLSDDSASEGGSPKKGNAKINVYI